MNRALCAIGLGGMFLFSTGCSNQVAAVAAGGDNQNSASQRLERVTVGKPSRKTLSLHTTQPGKIKAFETTPLFAKLTGFVEEVSVDIGDRVTRGDLLVSLAIPELHDDVERHTGLVAQARAEVERYRAQIEVEKALEKTAVAKIAQFDAGVERAEAEHDRWHAEHLRVEELAAKGAVNEKLADEMLNQYRASDAARREATAAVKSAQAQASEFHAKIRKAKAELEVAEANLKVAEAQLAHAESMASYARIVAPFDGVVTQRSVDTGHFVHPASGSASKPLLTVARTDKVRVRIDVPEMEASMVEVGDDAIVRIQATKNQTFSSKVARTSWSVDGANRSLHVEIDLPNEDSQLRPGMYAVASILLAQRHDVLTLPITAIVGTETESYCCVVDDGLIGFRRIELGLRSRPEVEILSGINDETKIVLARADSFQEGQHVEVITEE